VAEGRGGVGIAYCPSRSCRNDDILDSLETLLARGDKNDDDDDEDNCGEN